MKPVLLVDVVGLTSRLVSDRTPNLQDLGRRGAAAPMSAVLPAVTCSAQATMLTGLPPSAHGAVGNGWLDRASGEVALWRQSNALVSGEKVYEAARRLDRSFTCAKLFWWWNLGARVEWSITPRPFYPADGRKIPAIYAWPTELGLATERALGPFPFFDFWGPRAGLPSSRWIADAAARILAEHSPTLSLVYLPHLDYDFQRHGPDDERSRRAVEDVDRIVGDLRRGRRARRRGDDRGQRVRHRRGRHPDRREPRAAAVRAPRRARDAGGRGARHVRERGVRGRRPPGRARLRPFAEALEHARSVILALPGVETILEGEVRRAHGLDHPRAGDLVAVARPNAWFTYYYWLDDAAEPDFARTVDIHRKPGYDPCEMFVDPAIAMPKLRVARRLVQKKLGMRYLMDVIPLDPKLVRGSHGRLPDDPRDGPVFLSSRPLRDCGGDPRTASSR
jgi:hypothetical protein